MNSTSRGFEIGELRGEVAGLGDHRPRGRAEVDAEFARDDLRQRRLAEARRADEQHMIQRLAARLRANSMNTLRFLRAASWPVKSASTCGRNAASSSGRFSAETSRRGGVVMGAG